MTSGHTVPVSFEGEAFSAGSVAAEPVAIYAAARRVIFRVLE